MKTIAQFLVKNEEVINVANIQTRLGNNFRITGISNANEARQLSLLLRAGALIAPIQIVEERENHWANIRSSEHNSRFGSLFMGSDSLCCLYDYLLS